jgi:N-acetylglucosamine kinase-like BadF-type ATPase
VLESDGARRAELTAPAVAFDAGAIVIDGIVESIAADWPDADPDVVSAGMTGFLLRSDPRAVEAAIRRHWPRAAVLLTSDAVTALAGALGLAGGVVVAVGTGAVALATDFRDVWARVDGWGHLLGDDGAGAWIGQQGLRAALREADGRAGGSAALLGAFTPRLGEPDRWPAQVHASDRPAALLASFAEDVARVARGGDPVALGIWHEAGRALARTAAAALRSGVPAAVAVIGGISRADDLLRPSFDDELARHRGDADVRFVEARPVDGALLLGRAVLARDATRFSRPPFIHMTESGS